VHHLFPVFSNARDHFQQHLLTQGVATAIHYPVPVNLQPAFSDLGIREGQLPVSEAAARRALSLPLYPKLEDAQIERVARAALAFKEG
jgi:dTDP-4-amino-4,6-dideoxygalactose transaminase